MEMRLKLDDETVDVIFTGKEMKIAGMKTIKPLRASLDTKRVIPILYTIIIVVGLVITSMVIGSLFGRVDIAIISVAAGMGLAAVVYLSLSRMEQVLQIEHPSGILEFRGSSDDLRKLYYSVSKLTIKKMKDKEQEDEKSSLKGVGVTKGNSLLNKEELRSVKGDLKRSVVLGGRMIAQICPECGNDELYYEGGFMTGHVYHCKRCDYVGSFIMEKELDLRE